MSFTQVSNSSPGQSIPFSILDLKAQAVRLPVSKGAQILLSELLTWSGERGYCWWSKEAIAKDLKWSSSSVWRRTAELQEAGFLASIPRPGRSNYWVPLPGPAKMARLKNELTPVADSRSPLEKKKENLERCTVPNRGTSTEQPPPPFEPENVNAPKICPEEISPIQQTTSDTPLESVHKSAPLFQILSQPEPIQEIPTPPVAVSKPKAPITPEQMFLVEEIERVTGDTWSRGHFVNLVRQTDEQTIYGALSVTREKMAMESGVNGGAYFTSTVRGMIGLAGLGAIPVADITFSQQTRSDYPTSPPPAPLPHFAEPEPEPVDPEALKRGWRFHCRAAGARAMISLVQKCAPVSVDVERLWVDVRETFPGLEESILIDRLLDTVVTRIRHAERMAEVAE